MLTAKQAADHVGKSKATILKAIKSGRLSATKSADGEWRIDPAELFRVYQSIPTPPQNSALAHTSEHTASIELEALRRENALLLDERNDLRRRLDAEAEERRKLTALLTDQRRASGPEPAPQSPQKLVEGFRARLGRWIGGKG